MATHSIGVDKCNFPVTLPRALRRRAGRVAFLRDQALGAWMRELLVEAVARAERELRAAGRIAGRVGCLLVALGGVAALLMQIVTSQDDALARRGALRSRRRDEYAAVLWDDGVDDDTEPV